MTTLFTRAGSPFAGTPSLTEKGQPYTVVVGRCNRCGGAGGADKWKPTGWTCFDCGGNGKGKPETRKLYTAEQLVKLNATQAKRTAKRDATHQAKVAAETAAADARRAEFLAAHGALLDRAEPFAAADSFILDLVTRGRGNAKLTDKQIAALTTAVERLEARREAHAQAAATSEFIGTVGDRVELPVVIEHVASYERAPFQSYGRYTETVWIVTMVDAAGNQLVAKTPAARDLFDGEKAEAKGQAFTLRGTVKAHSIYKDVKQTVVERVKRVRPKGE